jgi:NhaP-type Na+/H+ or K+/H+ antiporter
LRPDLFSGTGVRIGRDGSDDLGRLRMHFASGMLIGASLGCTLGYMVGAILRAGQLADIADAELRSSQLRRAL